MALRATKFEPIIGLMSKTLPANGMDLTVSKMSQNVTIFPDYNQFLKLLQSQRGKVIFSHIPSRHTTHTLLITPATSYPQCLCRQCEQTQIETEMNGIGNTLPLQVNIVA